MKHISRIIAAGTLALTMASLPLTPVLAYGGEPGVRHDDRRDRDDRRDDRRARREWRRYDYNHFEPGQRGYDPARYYRDPRYYKARRLGRNDRIYVGYDNRYYCRRSDGTTGLIVGGLAGGVLGNLIAPGDSKTLGTILGAAGGAIVGRSIDRNNITCR